MGFLRRYTVEGLNLERFLQAAGESGITLTGLQRTGGRRLAFAVDEGCRQQLAGLAQSGGWLLTPGERTGAGRLFDRMAARWLLAAMLVFALVSGLMATQVLWRVEVLDAGVYEQDVRQALEEMGVSVPVRRSQVDTAAICEALQWRYPRVAWFEVGCRGMTLEVRMVEGVSGGTAEAAEGAWDIVAARDGVVHHIVTRAGTPVVSPGDVVQAGDVLIRGEERTSGGGVRSVAARGSVYARVWESASVQTPLASTETVYSGRTHAVQLVASPWFQLWQAEESGFAHEDVSVSELPLGGFFWPLVIRKELRYEADFRSVKTDLESLIAENERAALQKLYEIAGGKESLVDNWVNWSIIEDEILLSVATGERLVDIAQQERSSGMAATE